MNALNGIAMPGTKRVTREPLLAGCGASVGGGIRRLWAPILLTIIAFAAVIAVELVAAREAPALLGTSAREFAAEVGMTLAQVASTSILIVPVE
ncbi:MAG TPA: hypothetical protein VMN79_03965 [Casimicrobiaceae bacterium]|nr:hypothetical protein [Casimicrobiaceae bacterium]